MLPTPQLAAPPVRGIVSLQTFMQNLLEGEVVSIFLKDGGSKVGEVQGVIKPPASSARGDLGIHPG